MIGHPIRYKNTFLELDVPKLDLRRLVTSPGRLEEERLEEERQLTPTILARRGMPALRHLCSPFSMEEPAECSRSDSGDSDSTEDELQADKNPAPVRYKAHFVGLAKDAQPLDFRGLFSELLELRRPKVAAPEPVADSASAASRESSPTRSWADLSECDDEDAAAVERAPTPPRARTRADSSPRRVRVVSWAEPLAAAAAVPDAFAPGSPAAKETVNALEAVASTACETSLPPRSWADIESDDEDTVPVKDVQPARQSWADIESDDEETVPVKDVQPARHSWADIESDDEAPVKDVQPAEDGWTTVAKKERKAAEHRSWFAREPAVRPAVRQPAARPAQSSARGEKILVHLEDSPAFPVVRRLIGPGGANLRRIRDAHGAQVQLRGRGCGGSEPLHLLLTASPGANLRAACREAQALVRSVQEEFERSARRAR